jgi:hypothetical protein
LEGCGYTGYNISSVFLIGGCTISNTQAVLIRRSVTGQFPANLGSIFLCPIKLIILAAVQIMIKLIILAAVQIMEVFSMVCTV